MFMSIILTLAVGVKYSWHHNKKKGKKNGGTTCNVEQSDSLPYLLQIFPGAAHKMTKFLRSFSLLDNTNGLRGPKEKIGEIGLWPNFGHKFAISTIQKKTMDLYLKRSI